MPLASSPQDITGTIVRIDAAAQGVNIAFANCTTLPPGTAQVWAAWYAGWQKWSTVNANVDAYAPESLRAVADQAAAYEIDIAGWQEDADAICNAQIPVLVPQAKIAKENGFRESVLSTVRWVAGAVIVALIVPPIVEAVHSFHGKEKKPAEG